MTLEGIDYLENQYYTYNRRLLSIIGLWPYQESSIRLFYGCIINVILIINIFQQIYYVLFALEYKLELIIDQLQMLLPTLTFLCCYYNLLYNLSTLKIIFNRMRSNWDELADVEEVIVMQKYAKQTRIWTLSIARLYYLYGMFLVYPSIISLLLYTFGIQNYTGLILPRNIEYFVKDKTYYFPIIPLLFISIYIITSLGVVNYSLLVSFLQHARALFAITMMKIDRPLTKNSYPSKKTISSSIEKEHDWIINVIRCYNESIKFVDLIKLLFGKIYFVETFMASIYIIVDYLYLFQLLNFTRTINEALKDCVFIVGSLVMIYAYCYLGQKLIDHSTDIFIRCCHVPYYTLSLKTQKVLFMLIIKTMRPCNFSVTRMIVTSHELFANLMRTSFSYALVFYNVL